jgi:hypothetical protein
MTDPFIQTISFDGWSITLSRSDTVDLYLEGGPMPLTLCLNEDQAEELELALRAALENTQ